MLEPSVAEVLENVQAIIVDGDDFFEMLDLLDKGRFDPIEPNDEINELDHEGREVGVEIIEPVDDLNAPHDEQREVGAEIIGLF